MNTPAPSPLLEVCDVTKRFRRKNNVVDALNPFSFTLSQGEILGVIGESGSGKSTLLKLLTGLEVPTGGHIRLLGKDITGIHGRAARDVYRNMQMIFQHPIGSFNPRRRMRSSIIENMRHLRPSSTVAERNREVDRLLKKVGIPPDLADRYPHNLSGGQCQRIAIARALSVQPKILLCDEITSALDVSAQAHVIDLLLGLSREFGIAILFVSHDLSLACNFCEKIMVMHRGSCVETGSPDELISCPNQSYTRQLLASVVDPIAYLEGNGAG